MKKQPVKVQFVGKKNHYYLLRFPKLHVPVEVNEDLFRKMQKSSEYTILDASINKNSNTHNVSNIDNIRPVGV